MKQTFTVLLCVVYGLKGSCQNVGIGTTNPTQKLEVAGTVKATGLQMATGAASGKVLQSDSTGIASWQNSDLTKLANTFALPPCNQLAGTVGTAFNDPFNIAISGNYAYVCNLNSTGNYNNTVSIFDITTTTPVLVDTIGIGAGTNPRSVTISGNYLYVANQNSPNFMIYNVSNPVSPNLVATVATASSGGNYSIAASGSYTYVADRNDNMLFVYDVSNPANPTLVKTVTTGASPYRITISGNYAYLVNNTGQTLVAYDISTPSNTTQVGSVATGNAPTSVAVSGNFAYVSNSSSNTMTVYNISDPAAMTQVSSISTGTTPWEVAVANNYAYVANFGSSTLSVFDVSSPAAPILLSNTAVGTGPRSVAVAGNYAYEVNATANTMQVFKIGGCPVSASLVIGTGGVSLGPNKTTSAIVDVASIPANSSLIQTFAIANANLGSAVFISPSIALADGLVIAYARVSATGIVEVKFRNTTAAAIDPPAMNYYIAVIQ